jgi:hypothetical protein
VAAEQERRGEQQRGQEGERDGGPRPGQGGRLAHHAEPEEVEKATVATFDDSAHLPPAGCLPGVYTPVSR